MTLSDLLKSGVVMFRPEWMKRATYFLSPQGIVAFEYLDKDGSPVICYPRFNANQLMWDCWIETPKDFSITDWVGDVAV